MYPIFRWNHPGGEKEASEVLEISPNVYHFLPAKYACSRAQGRKFYVSLSHLGSKGIRSLMMWEWQKERFLRYTTKCNKAPSDTHFERTLSSLGWLLSLLFTPGRLFQHRADHPTLMSNYWSSKSIKGVCGVMWLNWKFQKKSILLYVKGENV